MSSGGQLFGEQELSMERKAYSKPILESLDIRETRDINIDIGIGIGLPGIS